MRTIAALLVLASSLLGFSCATPQGGPMNGPSVRVSRVEGHGDVFRQGRWQRARVGQALQAGDQARTTSGRIDFNLGDYGGVLTLQPDSALIFERIGVGPGEPRIVAVLNLTAGRVTGDTLDLPGDSRILVKTLDGSFEIP